MPKAQGGCHLLRRRTPPDHVLTESNVRAWGKAAPGRATRGSGQCLELELPGEEEEEEATVTRGASVGRSAPCPPSFIGHTCSATKRQALCRVLGIRR